MLGRLKHEPLARQIGKSLHYAIELKSIWFNLIWKLHSIRTKWIQFRGLRHTIAFAKSPSRGLACPFSLFLTTSLMVRLPRNTLSGSRTEPTVTEGWSISDMTKTQNQCRPLKMMQLATLNALWCSFCYGHLDRHKLLRRRSPIRGS